jgi:hypothetical protein
MYVFIATKILAPEKAIKSDKLPVEVGTTREKKDQEGKNQWC